MKKDSHSESSLHKKIYSVSRPFPLSLFASFAIPWYTKRFSILRQAIFHESASLFLSHSWRFFMMHQTFSHTFFTPNEPTNQAQTSPRKLSFHALTEAILPPYLIAFGARNDRLSVRLRRCLRFLYQTEPKPSPSSGSASWPKESPRL